MPKLLAGPILRQAQEDAVYVWLATSVELGRAELKVFGHSHFSKTPVRNKTPISANAASHQVKCGERLWIHMLACEPRATSSGAGRGMRAAPENPEAAAGATARRGSFPTGEFLAYDIEWQAGSEQATKKLADLADLKQFVYEPFDLPTFVLQKRGSARLNCIYGSCRKMHGYGLDAIEAGERTLARYAGDVRRRPHLLSLGGDQIYADDVADVMIRPIQQLAVQLLGKTEPVPGYADPAKIPIRGRMAIVNKQAKYTSGDAENHLMTFSEFAATYLLAWNPDLWPASLPSWSSIWHDSKPKLRVAEAKDVLEGQRRRVLQGRSGARHARRLLANVPTYMIFDDHEITDDWYLSNAWKKRAQNTALGRRLLAVGLGAFYVFQAWGNDVPEMHDDELLSAISKYASDPAGSGAELERRFLNFNDWSFRTPTRPSVIHTNTRTRREHTRHRVHWRFARLPLPGNDSYVLPNDAPRLMNYTERARLDALIRAARKQDARLVIVAPTPVYGLESMEWLQDTATSLGIPGTTLDNESFHADPNSFLDIVQKAAYADPSFVIFLSGDVHYGFTAVARAELTTRSVNIAQFTSSATKNEAHGGLRTGLTVLKTKPSAMKLLDQTRRWWRPYGNLESTLRIGTFGLLDAPANTAALVTSALKGPANFRDESKFIPKNAGGLSRLLYDDLVEITNNMGHLELVGREVVHKLVRLERPGSAPRSSLRTRWVSWPV